MLSDKLINTLLFSAANHANEAKPFGLSQWQQVRDHYFARAIEAEVRKQDDELMQQMLGVLEESSPYVTVAHEWKSSEWIAKRAHAITTARARLGENR